MTDWFEQEGSPRDPRDTIVKYYSSESTVHGTYILSVAITFFAFLQFIDEILPLAYSYWIISFAISLFLTLILYLLARTILWGTMASFALHTKELSIEDAKKELSDEMDTVNSLILLHLACAKRFRKKHSILRYFDATRGDMVTRYGVYIAFFAILFLAIPHVLPIIVG